MPPAVATLLTVCPSACFGSEFRSKGTSLLIEKVKGLYMLAQGLELPNEALAVALTPKSATDLANQALQHFFPVAL